GAASGFSASKIAEGAPAEEAPRPPSQRPESTRITQLDTPAVAKSAAEKAIPKPVVAKRSLEMVGLENENEQLRKALSEQRKAYEEAMAKAGQSNRIAELEEKIRLLESGGGGTSAAPSAEMADLQRSVATLTA